MPTATKITIEFDDGSTFEVNPKQAGSIFMNEGQAARCGHKPPYGKPPEASGGNTTMTAMSTTGECYIVNGVIVCPPA